MTTAEIKRNWAKAKSHLADELAEPQPKATVARHPKVTPSKAKQLLRKK